MGIFPTETTNTVFGSGVGSVFGQPQGATGADATPSLTFGPGQAASPMAQALLKRQAEVMGQLGVPSELADPNAAREANEAAIAKLATVNPELAQQLADQMTGSVDDDKSFFGHLKELAGDILAPALAIGGKALDILTRPGRIIPELITDNDNDPWYQDVAQALSGNSTASGSDVMKKWGVDNTAMRGILGFAFDVAADPLTYMTFGAAGFGRQAVARAAGATVAEGMVASSIREGIERGAIALASGQVDDTARRLVQGALGKKMHRDAAEGIAALSIEGLGDEMVAAAVEAGDHVTRAVSTRTIQKLGPKMYLESLGKEVDTKWVVDMIRNKSTLRGAKGKMAAGALGGVRFRAFKYISPALPGTEGVGFGAMSNFFRGYSGTSRIMRTINRADLPIGAGDEAAKAVQGATNGAMASWDDFEAFSLGGWKALEKKNDKLYHYLKGSIPGGSILVPLSEMVGGITSHFTPSAWMVRGGGLLGQMAQNGKLTARDGVMDFVMRHGYTLRDESGTVVRSQREVLKLLDGLKTADRETQKSLRWFIDATPDAVGDDLSGLDQWADDAIGVLDSKKSKGLLNEEDYAARVEAIENRKAAITEKFHSFSPKQQETVWTIKKLLGQHREFANLQGARLRDVTSAMSKIPVALRQDADEYVRDGHKAAREVDLYYVPEGIEYTTLREKGFSDPSTLGYSNGLGRGVVLTDTVATGPGPKEGHVRLWRGDGPRPEGFNLVNKGTRGQSFTTNRDTALHFTGPVAKAPADPSRLSYVDVPQSWLDELDRSGLTDDEWDIPSEWLNELASGAPVNRAEITADAVPVAVRLENPLVIDHRAGKATEQQILDELRGEADKVIRSDPNKYALGTDPEDYEEVLSQKVDEMVTEALKRQERDGVVEILEDGTRRVVVFDSSDLLSKAKVVSDEFGTQAIDTQGYYSRRFSSEMSEWINGVVGQDENLKRIFHEEKARRFLHLDVDEAEGKIREEFRQQLQEVAAQAKGVEKNQIEAALKRLDALDIFTMNPIEGLHRYVQSVSEHLAERHLVTLGSRMARLSNLGAFGPGGAVQRSIYKYVEPIDTLKELDGVVVKGLKHFKDGGRAGQKALNATMRRTQTESEEFARIRSVITDGRSARSAKRASVDFGRTIAKDIATVRQELTALKSERRQSEKALAQLSSLGTADEAVDHGFTRSLDDIQADIAEADENLRDLISLAQGKDGQALVSGAVARAFENDLTKAGKATETTLKQAQKSAARIANAEKRVARWEARMSDAVNEVNRLQTKYRTVSNDMKPAFLEVAAGEGVPTGWKRVNVKGMPDNMAMPEMVAKEFEGVFRDGLDGAHRAVRGFTNQWKRFSTIYWFGFHVRNNYGAMFNNALMGVTPEDYKWALNIRRSVSLTDNKRNAGKLGGAKTLIPSEVFDQYGLRYLVGDVFEEVTENGHKGVRLDELGAFFSGAGITGSNVLHDTRNVLDDMARNGQPTITKEGAVREAGRKAGEKVKAGGRVYGGAMERLTDLTENVHRTAAMLAGLRQTGGDVYNARLSTMMRHGDYADLTDFEFKVVKDVMPFYKWLRTNLPYQFHNLIENPAKHLTTLKLTDATFEVQGLDPDEERAKMPEWMRDAVAIPIGAKGKDGINYLVADIPMADLHTGINEYFSALLPTVRPLIESFVFEKSAFTKAPLEGKMVPLAAWANLPVLRDFLTATGIAEEGADGETYINDKYENVLQAAPIYARFRNWALADEKRVKNRMNTISSVLFGAQSRTIDTEDMTAAEKGFYYNEILPAVTRAKSMGVILPSKDEVADFVYNQLGFTPPQENN